MSEPRTYATDGKGLRCRGWRQEGLLRLLENVLAVAEDPEHLVVYAALGKAARNKPAYDAIVRALKQLCDDETLIIQSGKPIAVLTTHARAPLVLMANCNLVGRWANEEVFYDLEQRGLICWGGLTAGCWQYIGSQGVLQGTYEILARVAARLGAADLRGRFFLTAGLGGMGSAQPRAASMLGAASLVVEVDAERAAKRLKSGAVDALTESLPEALAGIERARSERRAWSVALVANAADVFPAIARGSLRPDIVTDQTAAHDLLYGYVPQGYTPADVRRQRSRNPAELTAAGLRSIGLHVRAMLELKDAGAIVFDNGNLIRSQAARAGVARAFEIPIFTEAFLRPLFCEGIGPFRWIALSGDAADIRAIDDHLLKAFAQDPSITNWIRVAREAVPFEGLPARIAWLGHGARTALGLAVNDMVRSRTLKGPIAFTRDHLDAGAMTHPKIMTENLRDGSDAITDWPLLDALVNCASQADLVAIHSGGGGYAGYMTSAGVTVIADGTSAAEERLRLTLTNDTSLGVLRYADAGYEAAVEAAEKAGLHRL
ncbi:MAG TPA: urocanate hydratase [Steroidobacteraceae bacterium]|nr:urocanate hydratase [Steroidobacteraceae bacterium]